MANLSIDQNNYRRLVDFIYLRKVLSLPANGLFKLFKDPQITISSIKSLNKELIRKVLFPKGQRTLDDSILVDKSIDTLINFQYNSNKEYLKIKGMVDYCLAHDIKILIPNLGPLNLKEPPLLFDCCNFIPLKMRDLLFIKGDIIAEDIKSYSICGTRDPTDDGRNKAYMIAEYFAEHNFTLINGFAKGIDIVSYLGAASKGGRYIGVLGSGLENIYPPENKKYINKIIRHGALISQRLLFSCNSRVTKEALQMRNRLSAQLSLGSIFIEGTYKSGTKWQLKFAKGHKRKLFYLEPKNWKHPNAYIPKLVKSEGGIEIKNDLSNLGTILKILNNEYLLRAKKIPNLQLEVEK